MQLQNSGCSNSSFYCNERSGSNRWFEVPEWQGCRGIEEDFNFGVFSDAIQSGIVEVTSFVMKFSYCLRWGLQSLRCNFAYFLVLID